MTIQLGTSLFYDRASDQIGTLNTQAATLQTQISTGKKLQAPADDVTAYQRLQTLARGKADDTANGANIALAQASLKQADTTLASIGDSLVQARELAIQGNSGVLTQQQRGTIADQIDGILATVTGLANTKDARGTALFAGPDGGDAVAQNASGGFTLATVGPASIPTSATGGVQPGEPAAQVFGGAGGTDMFTTLSKLSAALRAPGDQSAAIGQAADALTAAHDTLSAAQGSLGARAKALDVEAARLTAVATDREAARSALEDTDVTSAITELQKTMTVLQAAQASFSRLSQLNLFSQLH